MTKRELRHAVDVARGRIEHKRTHAGRAVAPLQIRQLRPMVRIWLDADRAHGAARIANRTKVPLVHAVRRCGLWVLGGLEELA